MKSNMPIETLESRRLLTITLSGGTLTLTGTGANNRLVVDETDGAILVNFVGVEDREFSLSQVDRMVVDAVGGNDSIVVRLSSSKPVTVKGGSGDDVIVNQTGGSFIGYGGDGNDSFHTSDPQGVYGTSSSGSATLFGDGGNDTFFDDADDQPLGHDRIEGGSGHDDIRGLMGGDTIYGGDGNDIIAPLTGSPSGADLIYGGTGDDWIDGSVSNDTIWGEDGKDTINGAGGNDSIRGGSNNDSIAGGSGKDTIKGDGGNDTVKGGSDSDR
ncbi:MAG TPA: calcium-binding protein, partial [Tepidisphaeraceae bacterium]|nr:calcium-binding protein [Tepidisphaeraceae bacterium]